MQKESSLFQKQGAKQKQIADVSREGTFISGGQTISAFDRDLTLIRLITEVDFACRHPQAFVKGTFAQA